MEETKKCPYCGETILAAAKKCKYCGEWLPEEDSEPSEKKMIACPVCGEEIEEGTKKCPYCHEPVMQEKHTKEIETQNTVYPTEPLVTNESPEETKSDSQKSGFFEYYFEEAWGNETANLIPGFNFSGRMPRKQFWISTLMFSAIFGTLSVLFIKMIPYYNWTKIFLVIFMILWTIKSIEMQVRRLHDINKSGWLVILSYIPVANLYPFILFCMKGSESKKTQWNKKDSLNLSFMVVFFIIVSIVANMINGLNSGDSSGDELTPFESIVNPESTSDSDITFIGSSASGKYAYYLKNGENSLIQVNTETDEQYTISLDDAIEDVFVGGIDDYTVHNNKIIFITNNGANGMMAANDAFYLGMDDETWCYITFAKSITFNNDKTALIASSPTSEAMDEFTQTVYDLNDL